MATAVTTALFALPIAGASPVPASPTVETDMAAGTNVLSGTGTGYSLVRIPSKASIATPFGESSDVSVEGRTKSDFVGWDPEAGFTTGNANSTTSQVDVGGPAFRTFLFGLDLNF